LFDNLGIWRAARHQELAGCFKRAFTLWWRLAIIDVPKFFFENNVPLLKLFWPVLS